MHSGFLLGSSFWTRNRSQRSVEIKNGLDLQMSLPVISVQQMREWEKAAWSTGQTEANVIARVGKIVAERALQLTQANDVVLILSGKGHNGDDARAALPHLRERKIIQIDAL